MNKKDGFKGLLAGVVLTSLVSMSFSAFAGSVQKQITVTYDDIKVTVNGRQASLKDSDGNAVEPFNYNGSVYLPVRAISEALGLTASYDDATHTVSLTGKGGPGGSSDGTNGTPPGQPPAGGPGGVPGGASGAATTTGTAEYTQSGQTVTKSNQTITATETDESGIKVSDGGVLNLSDSTVTKTGDTSSEDGSNFYGLNAAVLAESGSSINLTGSTINTSANGANAVFATGDGSTITVSNVKINTTADSSRGLDATLTGTVIASDVEITTAGMHSAAIATDRGNGTVTVKGGTMTTSGVDSPGIYSTGNITVSDATLTATGSEAAVVEGRNSITLTNTTLSGAKKRGVMLYQSYSGDAEVGTARFTMNGGSLTAAVGPLFYVTNTEAIIELKDADVTAASGTLLTADGAGQWGVSGSNGGKVTFKADGETLAGNITCDSISTIAAILKNGTILKGSINADNTAKSLALTLDSTSTWNVTGDSYLTSLTDEDTTLANIDDNGYTIYYDASDSANSWLNGKTYTLTDGGKLTPVASAN